MKILYLCDQKTGACKKEIHLPCFECRHTSNINHAKNAPLIMADFQKGITRAWPGLDVTTDSRFEKIGEAEYWEKED